MSGRADTPSDLFDNAAGILAAEASADRPSLDFLDALQYRDGSRDAAAHRIALLRAAARFKRVFWLRAEDAPGLVAVGAEVDAGHIGVPNSATGSVSGASLGFREAFESCIGEGVEYIAQFATPEDRFIPMSADEAQGNATPAMRALWQRLLPYRTKPEADRTDWALAANLADGSPVLLPADLCFRRPADIRDITPPWPLSTGCGAGTDKLGATLHGLLELVERDAVAMWLRGGMRPRQVHPGPGAARLDQLRGGSSSRRTWLLDVTSDIRVPVVAAVACNDDGFGLCRGVACRPTLADAADAALTELAQMELAYRISAVKLAVQGEAALNGIDRQHIERFTKLDVADYAMLHPLAPPAPPCDLLAQDKAAILTDVRQRIEHVGSEVYAIDLTRPALGIPVTRTFAPGLELGLTSPAGPRLCSMGNRSGADPARPILL